jgi:hypothetical protein
MPIDPTPFITLSSRGHRPRIGKEPRVHMSSATVDPTTKAAIIGWMAQLGASQGVVTDSVVRFAKSKGFPPKAKK